MDTVTYPHPQVAELVNNHFIPARVRVKENPDLVKEYLVSWTPHVVVTDEQGRVHYRIEGYFPPTEFMAQMSLGAGKYHLHRGELAQATQRFEEVAQRHRGSQAGAEALYWLSVCHYKESHNPAQLRQGWGKLAQEYPDSDWTIRSKVPQRPK